MTISPAFAATQQKGRVVDRKHLKFHFADTVLNHTEIYIQISLQPTMRQYLPRYRDASDEYAIITGTVERILFTKIYESFYIFQL